MQNLLLFKKPANIRLSVFPGNTTDKSLLEDRETSYRCWRSVWDEVFKSEMHLQKKLFSDEFARQDAIVSLFCEDRCVGLAMIRIVSLETELTFDDSFFRFWTPKGLKELRSICGPSPLALASAFTLAPEFRGRTEGINWKTLLLALYLEKFLTTSAGIMVTAARKIRANERLCRSLGAQLLDENVPYTQDGIPVAGEIADLLYWPRNLFIDLGSSELNELKARIWRERKDISFRKEGERNAA